MSVGGGEEEFALYKVDLIGVVLLSSEAHGRLGISKVAADDQRVCPQVVIETKHHGVASFHHHI